MMIVFDMMLNLLAQMTGVFLRGLCYALGVIVALRLMGVHI